MHVRLLRYDYFRFVRPGIVGAVMAIKHIAMQPDDETNIWPDKASEDFDENQLTEQAKRALPFLSM